VVRLRAHLTYRSRQGWEPAGRNRLRGGTAVEGLKPRRAASANSPITKVAALGARFQQKLQISENIKKDARENLLALEEQSRPSHFCESRLGLVEYHAAFSA